MVRSIKRDKQEVGKAGEDGFFDGQGEAQLF